MTVSPLAQDMTQPLLDVAQATRQAAQTLASLSAMEKNRAIDAVADALEANARAIVASNREDCEAAVADNLAKPLYGRLKLDEVKLAGAIAGVRDVARLPDPVGTMQLHRELDDGLVLKRLTVPLGVLGVIFESRPDAVMQISALAIKSGNGVILKGGKEAVRSCTALVNAIKQGLEAADVDPAAVQLLTTREETRALLDLEGYVDLIIPRGSNAFVRFVQDNTRIPVLGHADGICHLYIDSEADLEQAIAIAIDAKTAYPSACNAIETLLIHQNIALAVLPNLAITLREAQVEIRGDEPARDIVSYLIPTDDDDWTTEYSDLILAVKVVESLEDAIAHIN
ncbi:MAG: glutamate-5-semialdehyde dehydrogenase, partial [Cyanobacteria bacterium J06638_6]